MKNYFDFIMYLAFRTILIYENKRSLTVEQLHNYRKKICEKHIEYHNQFTEYDDEQFEENLRFFHSSNANMTLSEESQNLIDFINDNDDYFFYKDGIITLKDGITYKELVNASFEVDSYIDRDDKIICGELLGLLDCIDCLNILEAKKIKEFVLNIINDEKKIENAYQNYSGIELEEKTKKLLALVKYRLALISNLNTDKISSCHRTINGLGKIDISSKGKDIWLLSDFLMENDKFYNLNDRHIDNVINNGYQKAIFDDGTLVYDRLNDLMNAIWAYKESDVQLEVEPVDPEAFFLSLEEKMNELESFEDEFNDENNVESDEDDDEDEYDEDEYDDEDDMNQIDYYLYEKRINMLFYLNYINHINKFDEIFGIDEILKISKGRLLYLLDGYGDNLFKEENLQQSLKNISTSEINYKQDLDDFYTLSRLFLVDILEKWINDEMTLKKILYISTYYDLTKDKRIKKIINKYKQTKLGESLSNIILESDYSKLKSFIILPTKKMIKKKNDLNK